MRNTVFTMRPVPKKTCPRRGSAQSRIHSTPNQAGNDPEDAYEGDADTELDNARPKATFTPHTRPPLPQTTLAQTARRIEEIRSGLTEPELTIYGDRYMSADATEEGILELIARLQQLRAKSHPDIFDRLWEANIARLEEGEDIDEVDRDQRVEPFSGQTQWRGDDVRLSLERAAFDSTAPVIHPRMGLSNEPFASQGPPSRPSFPVPDLLPPMLPETMTVYISSTAGANAAHHYRAYTWLDAPVQQDDMDAFFVGLDARVDDLDEDEDVRGWTFCYGWNDMCRWITSTKARAEERHGWEMFQRDLRRAAENGVGVWRMKVLVIGK